MLNDRPWHCARWLTLVAHWLLLLGVALGLRALPLAHTPLLLGGALTTWVLCLIALWVVVATCLGIVAHKTQRVYLLEDALVN